MGKKFNLMRWLIYNIKNRYDGIPHLAKDNWERSTDIMNAIKYKKNETKTESRKDSCFPADVYQTGTGHAKMCLMPYANNKRADQPAHPQSDHHLCCSLLRLYDMYTCYIQISRFCLASVAEQAGLSVTWSKISEDTFSRDVAQTILNEANRTNIG